MSDRVYLAVVRDGCVLQEHSVYAGTARRPAFERWALPDGGLLPDHQPADPDSGTVTAHRWLPLDDWPHCPEWLHRVARGDLRCHFETHRY